MVAEALQAGQYAIRATIGNSGVEMKFAIAVIFRCKNLLQEHIFSVVWGLEQKEVYCTYSVAGRHEQVLWFHRPVRIVVLLNNCREFFEAQSHAFKVIHNIHLFDGVEHTVLGL